MSKAGINTQLKQIARINSYFINVKRIQLDTYLLFLFVEVINDDTNEQVKREEGSKYDEEDEIQIHVDVAFLYGLLTILQNMENRVMCQWLFSYSQVYRIIERYKIKINYFDDIENKKGVNCIITDYTEI